MSNAFPCCSDIELCKEAAFDFSIYYSKTLLFTFFIKVEFKKHRKFQKTLIIKNTKKNIKNNLNALSEMNFPWF